MTIFSARAGRLQELQAHLLDLHCDDSGQDLIEYALIAALLALSAVMGMGSVAKAVNDVFSSVGQKVNAYIV